MYGLLIYGFFHWWLRILTLKLGLNGKLSLVEATILANRLTNQI